MRRPHPRLTVWLATIAAILAAIVLTLVVDPSSKIAASRTRLEARASSRERSARATVSVAHPEALALGERRAVEVEGQPLIVDDFAAFPALGDLDGDGRMDLLLGDPRGFLKLYRNVGGPAALRLSTPVPFGEFCDDERIPTG